MTWTQGTQCVRLFWHMAQCKPLHRRVRFLNARLPDVHKSYFDVDFTLNVHVEPLIHVTDSC